MIGPVISVLSFVCSIGNVPLAGVLWNGGISFGGVTAFIFADLIIIPILIIYRKYYGTKMMLTILGIFYAAMVLAGYVIEFLFGGLGLIPAEPDGQGHRDGHHVELHHRPQHRLPAAGRRAAGALLPHRRQGHAQDDGRQPRQSRTPRPPRTGKPPAYRIAGAGNLGRPHAL